MTVEPRSILIAALGGEGGGVLAEWIHAAAERAGLAVQSTSVPGVAQRTGATSYYIEFAPPAGDGTEPVFALMPVPGRVDVLLASELLEAARMVERGFVDPERTLVITADHRVLTTLEKMARGDGRFDDERLRQALQDGARRCLALDLQAITRRHGTVISAVLFGALAGSGALPWPRAVSEEVVRAGGLGVQASLAGFAEAFDRAAAAGGGAGPAAARSSPALADIVERGQARLADYQDADHAASYRGRVDGLVRAAGQATGPEIVAAIEEAARSLALWMSYEDVIRVADLKTRRARFERVQAEAGAGPDDVVEIREHLRPGLEELAAIAPRRLGAWLRQRGATRKPGARPPGRSLALQTSSVTGFALLRLLAGTRRWRRHSLRFAEEDAAIERWLAALRSALPAHAGMAAAIAELPRLRKGYSDTFERGRSHYDALFDTWVAPGRNDDEAAAALRAGIAAAMAPDDESLPSPSRHAAGPAPVRWQPRDSSRAGTAPAAPSSTPAHGDKP